MLSPISRKNFSFLRFTLTVFEGYVGIIRDASSKRWQISRDTRGGDITYTVSANSPIRPIPFVYKLDLNANNRPKSNPKPHHSVHSILLQRYRKEPQDKTGRNRSVLVLWWLHSIFYVVLTRKGRIVLNYLHKGFSCAAKLYKTSECSFCCRKWLFVFQLKIFLKNFTKKAFLIYAGCPIFPSRCITCYYFFNGTPIIVYWIPWWIKKVNIARRLSGGVLWLFN